MYMYITKLDHCKIMGRDTKVIEILYGFCLYIIMVLIHN